MRILLTTDTVGGVWTFTEELSSYLLRQGNAVALASFGRNASAAQQEWVRDTAERYPDAFVFHESTVPLEWMEKNERAFVDGAKDLEEMACSFRPELLHSNQLCWGALELDVPRMITAHSDVMSWMEACRPSPPVESQWLTQYKALVQRGLNGADAIVAPTRWMREALQRNFRIDSPFEVIYNGRSVSLPRGTSQRLFQAASVGRLWDEAKGLTTLLSIAPPMPIYIAGEQHFGNADAMPCNAGITALGPLPQDEVFALFKRSSIYIVSSIYEPFGLAPLEAALCGCAIVARNIPSLREVWGNAALYFSNADELAMILEKLAADPEMIEERQQACSRRANAFGARQMGSRYLALYERLLRSSSEEKSLDLQQEFACDAA